MRGIRGHEALTSLTAVGAGPVSPARQKPGGTAPARAGDEILGLQRTYGNRHVQRAGPGMVVAPTGSRNEREADRLASDVVVGTIHRQAGATHDPGGRVDGETAHDIAAARHGGSPLAPPTRADMEGALGADLGAVRMHTDDRAGELCERISAQAFTLGAHVFFRHGRPDVSSPAGRHLVAHELAHVAQHAPPGVVHRTTYIDGPDAWEAATTHPTQLMVDKPRSTALRGIDAAVVAARVAYRSGRLDILDARLTQLQRAIDDWRARPRGIRRTQTPQLRVAEVNKLEAERNTLQLKVGRWQAGHALAVANHRRHRAEAVRWLAEGSTAADARLRNAVQWVLSKVRLYVVTSTGDDVYRAQQLLRKPTLAAADGFTTFFPDPRETDGQLFGEEVEYDQRNALDDTNVMPRKGGLNGWRGPGYIALTDVAFNQGRDTVFATLRHEVQHDADKHRGRELNQGVREAAGQPGEVDYQKAMRRYKTEYRAHFYEDPAAPVVATRSEQQLGVNWTPRQWTLFQQIRDRYPDIRAAAGADAPGTASQRRFVHEVNQYANPDEEGFNKYDSPGIDNVYEALDRVPVGTDDWNIPTVRALLRTFADLRRTDVDYLLTPTESVMLRAKIRHHLTDDARREFFARLIEIRRRFQHGPLPRVL